MFDIIVPENDVEGANLNASIFKNFDTFMRMLLADILCNIIYEEGIDKALDASNDLKVIKNPSQQNIINYILQITELEEEPGDKALSLEHDHNLIYNYRILAEFLAYAGHTYLGKNNQSIEDFFTKSRKNFLKSLEPYDTQETYNPLIARYIDLIYKHYSSESNENLKISPIEFYLNQPEFNQLKRELRKNKRDKSDGAINKSLEFDPRRNDAIFQLGNIILVSSKLKPTKDHKTLSSSPSILKIATPNIQAYLYRKVEEIGTSNTKDKQQHLNANMQEIDRFSNLLYECYTQLDANDKNKLFGDFNLICSDKKLTGSDLFKNLTESYLAAGKFDEALKYYRYYKKLEDLRPKDSKQNSPAYDLHKKITIMKSIQDKLNSISKNSMTIKNNLEQLEKPEIKLKKEKQTIDKTASLLQKNEKLIYSASKELTDSSQYKNSPIWIKIQNALGAYEENWQTSKKALQLLQNKLDREINLSVTMPRPITNPDPVSTETASIRTPSTVDLTPPESHKKNKENNQTKKQPKKTKKQKIVDEAKRKKEEREKKAKLKKEIAASRNKKPLDNVESQSGNSQPTASSLNTTPLPETDQEAIQTKTSVVNTPQSSTEPDLLPGATAETSQQRFLNEEKSTASKNDEFTSKEASQHKEPLALPESQGGNSPSLAPILTTTVLPMAEPQAIQVTPPGSAAQSFTEQDLPFITTTGEQSISGEEKPTTSKQDEFPPNEPGIKLLLPNSSISPFWARKQISKPPASTKLGVISSTSEESPYDGTSPSLSEFQTASIEDAKHPKITAKFKKNNPQNLIIKAEEIPNDLPQDLTTEFNSTELCLTPDQVNAFEKLAELQSLLTLLGIKLSPGGTLPIELATSVIWRKKCFVAGDIDAPVTLSHDLEKLPALKAAMKKAEFIIDYKNSNATCIKFIPRDQNIKIDIPVKLANYLENDNPFLLTTFTLDFKKIQKGVFNFTINPQNTWLLNYWIKRGQFPIKLPEYDNTNVRHFFYRLLKYIHPDKNKLLPFFYIKNQANQIQEIPRDKVGSYWENYFHQLATDPKVNSHLKHHYQTMSKIIENSLCSQPVAAEIIYYLCLANLNTELGLISFKAAKNMTVFLQNYFTNNSDKADIFYSKLNELLRYSLEQLANQTFVSLLTMKQMMLDDSFSEPKSTQDISHYCMRQLASLNPKGSRHYLQLAGRNIAIVLQKCFIEKLLNPQNIVNITKKTTNHSLSFLADERNIDFLFNKISAGLFIGSGAGLEPTIPTQSSMPFNYSSTLNFSSRSRTKMPDHKSSTGSLSSSMTDPLCDTLLDPNLLSFINPGNSQKLAISYDKKSHHAVSAATSIAENSSTLFHKTDTLEPGVPTPKIKQEKVDHSTQSKLQKQESDSTGELIHPY